MRTLRGPRLSHRQAGFTILEMLVTITIFLVVLYGVYVVYDAGEVTYSSTTREWDVQSQARFALERMAREIRMAGYSTTGAVTDPLVIATTDTISFHADVGDGNGLQYITYGLRNCDSTISQTLYRNASTTTYCGGQAVIDGIMNLTFYFYEINGLPIPYPAQSTYQLDSVNYVTGANAPSTTSLTSRNSVRQVKISLTVQQTVGATTVPFTVTTDVALRNLLP